MRIAVLRNDRVSGVNQVTKAVCATLRGFGADVLLPNGKGVLPTDCDSLIEQSDVVLALGGDGTLIHVAKHAARFGRAVLGINCGHLGFMAGLEADELSDLNALIQGEYTVSSRMLLEVSVHTSNKKRTYHALNEAVISRGSVSRMICLSVSSDGRPVAAYRADGVIVATPTGSTAYSLSAGGPIVDPAVNCLLMTPVCPHSLHTRPYIFGDSAELTIQPESEDGDIVLTVDGEEAVPISANDTITVARSKLSASIIQIRPKAFYEVLNQKLMDR